MHLRFRSFGRTLLLAGGFNTLALLGFSQSAVVPHHVPTRDTDSRRRTLQDEASAAAAATSAPVTGTFVSKFTVKLVTPVPSGGELACSLNATTDEINTTTGTVSNEIEEIASVKATVNGSTATCTVTLPYSWYLSSPSTDTVELSYNLQILSSTTSTAGTVRYSSQFVPGAGSIKVPASGSTTTYTISATL